MSLTGRIEVRHPVLPNRPGHGEVPPQAGDRRAVPPVATGRQEAAREVIDPAKNESEAAKAEQEAAKAEQEAAKAEREAAKAEQEAAKECVVTKTEQEEALTELLPGEVRAAVREEVPAEHPVVPTAGDLTEV